MQALLRRDSDQRAPSSAYTTARPVDAMVAGDCFQTSPQALHAMSTMRV